MVVCPYINPSFAELSCGSRHQTEMGPDAAAQEYVMSLWGLVGLTAFLVPSVLQAAHMQDSCDILTSYGLDSKVHRREHVLAQRGREVGPSLASGERAQGISSFRETYLGGRFHQELWGLPANVTACWTSREHCIPASPASTLPGQLSHGLLVGTHGQGHPFLSFRLALIPLMTPETMQGPCQTTPWGQVWFQGNLEQQPEDSNYLLHFVPSW